MKSQETWWTDLLFIFTHCEPAGLVILCAGIAAGLFGGYLLGAM
jgi:hypothetical protein